MRLCRRSSPIDRLRLSETFLSSPPLPAGDENRTEFSRFPALSLLRDAFFDDRGGRDAVIGAPSRATSGLAGSAKGPERLSLIGGEIGSTTFFGDITDKNDEDPPRGSSASEVILSIMSLKRSGSLLPDDDAIE